MLSHPLKEQVRIHHKLMKGYRLTERSFLEVRLHLFQSLPADSIGFRLEWLSESLDGFSVVHIHESPETQGAVRRPVVYRNKKPLRSYNIRKHLFPLGAFLGGNLCRLKVERHIIGPGRQEPGHVVRSPDPVPFKYDRAES